jgi:hypothetical protein
MELRAIALRFRDQSHVVFCFIHETKIFLMKHLGKKGSCVHHVNISPSAGSATGNSIAACDSHAARVLVCSDKFSFKKQLLDILLIRLSRSEQK